MNYKECLRLQSINYVFLCLQVSKTVATETEDGLVYGDPIAMPIVVDEHIDCECKCRILKEHCNKLQEYNENECECHCRNENDRQKCLEVRHP